MVKHIFLFVSLSFLSCSAYAQQNKEYADWIKKAMAFYYANQYQQSADAFSKAFVLVKGEPPRDDRYNAACSWARAGNDDSAFYQLNKLAANKKFTDYNHMIVDGDLVGLHTDSRWEPLCAAVKQNKEKAEANYNKPLVAILDTVSQDDQEGRMKLMDIQQKFGVNSKEEQELWKAIIAKDSVDLIKVGHILDKYGWLGPGVIGPDGNSTLFLVIQHSAIKVQEKYLPMMRAAVKNKKANPADLALLEDRVALGEGKKQIYGSQLKQDGSGHYWVSPIADPDNVDKRRAKVGLPPMADYVQLFNVKWDLKEYKKELPEIEKKEWGR